MSTERGGGAEQSRSFQSGGAAEAPATPSPSKQRIGDPAQSQPLSGAGLLTGREEVVTGETGRGLYQVQTAVVSESEQSPLASKPEPPQAEGATASTEGLSPQSEGSQGFPSRQVIAVSASKGPAAFFNLARKFLVTDEMCDLSALEGAIVSAVDAAHLLERSKLATIVRYVVFIRRVLLANTSSFHFHFFDISYSSLMAIHLPQHFPPHQLFCSCI